MNNTQQITDHPLINMDAAPFATTYNLSGSTGSL
jgi:hypothetical protein